MDPDERSEFVENYEKVLARAWADETYARRLRESPARVLDQVGLRTPPGATVEVIARPMEPGEDQSVLEEQVRLWEEAETTGSYRLLLPETPRVATAELAESELSRVTGGTGGSQAVDASGGFQ
jgi:hypothetical protein